MARHDAPKAVMRLLPLLLVREFMTQEGLTPTRRANASK
jgi:hypothetical protein